MRAISADERPRERLLQLGPEKLSNEELLAILLRTGVRGRSAIELARELLHHCERMSPDSGLKHLFRLRQEDLSKVVPGIGAAKLCQILAALQLGQRATAMPLKALSLSHPKAVFEYLAPRMSHLDREQFQVILLNAKNHVLSVESISEGTLTASLVHPREVFQPAIRRSAHAIILAHNHPSGDTTPSREDREITQRLIQAGKLIGIEVLDHLIIGDGRYLSFRERGLADWS